MKRLKVTFDGESFYANLLPEKAPKIISAIERSGPIHSFLVYAKICDHELTWPIDDLVYEMENPVWFEAEGSVIYYPPNQAFCIFYGSSPAVAECSQFAEMPRGELERMRPHADKVWANHGMPVTTEIVEVCEGGDQR